MFVKTTCTKRVKTSQLQIRKKIDITKNTIYAETSYFRCAYRSYVRKNNVFFYTYQKLQRNDVVMDRKIKTILPTSPTEHVVIMNKKRVAKSNKYFGIKKKNKKKQSLQSP